MTAYQAYQERASRNSILGSLNNISKAIGACLALNAPGDCDDTTKIRIGQLTGQTLIFHTVNNTAAVSYNASNHTDGLCAFISNDNHRGCTNVNAGTGAVTTQVSGNAAACSTYTTQASCDPVSGCTWMSIGTVCDGTPTLAGCTTTGACM